MTCLEFLLPYFSFCLSIMMPFNMALGDEILVTIPQGTLRGRKETSTLGDIYYSFQGIPYGKPPVGELRFKPPQPADKWTGIRDASKPGNVCFGKDMWYPDQLAKNSNEDCLHLQIYTKEIPKPGKKYPVLVWIHGGGYDFGVSNKNFFSPDFFMSHDIIFVPLSYRLGALGFLSLQNLDCPGNFGLKDQRLALKWIQDNILYFGGNPDKVTLFGESAGASAVHNHVLSPLSKGLFHRAICMSAVSNNPWGFQRHPRENAYLLVKRLGYHAKNDKELLDFLRKVPAGDIVVKSKLLLEEIEGARVYENIMNVSFVPITEPEHDGAFMTTRPLKGKYQADVPLLVGNNDKEMMMEIYSPEQVPQWTEDKQYQALIPRWFRVKKDSEKSLEIARKIRGFYFKNGMTIDGYIDVLSDIYFNHGIYRAVKSRFDNKIKSPTFFYLFSFDGEFSYLKKFLEHLRGVKTPVKGVGHADELAYFYILPGPNFTLIPGTPEHKTIQRVTQLWVNFATAGVPTNEKSETKWLPMETPDGVYLDIAEELELKKGGVFIDRMKFWDEMFKIAGEELL